MTALALGASAVNMGTRFIATDEAPVHDTVKRQVVANSERDTQLIFRSFHNTARVAKNSVSEEIAEISSRAGTCFADVADLASGARGRERFSRRSLAAFSRASRARSRPACACAAFPTGNHHLFLNPERHGSATATHHKREATSVD